MKTPNWIEHKDLKEIMGYFLVMLENIIKNERRRIIKEIEKIQYEAYTPALRRVVVDLKEAIKIVKDEP